MTALIVCLLLFSGQLTTPKEVVRLPPGKAAISRTYDGKLVELIDAPPDIGLPFLPPSGSKSAPDWSVRIKNLGPHDVTIQDGKQFTLLLHPNESATIAQRGSTYVQLH